MTLIRKYFSGASLTQALLMAASHHQIDPDDLAYKLIEKKHGFVKTPRGVTIEVDPEQPRRAESQPAADNVATPGASETMEGPESSESPERAASAEGAEDSAPAASAAVVEQVAAANEETERESGPESGLFEVAAEQPAPVDPSLPDGSGLFGIAPEHSAPEQPAPEHPAPEPPPVFEGVETATAAVEVEAGGEPSPVADEAPAPAPQARPSRAAEPPVVVDDALRESVAAAVDELAHLAGLMVQMEGVESNEDGLQVELGGPDGRQMTSKGGRALLAMQHLLPRLLYSEVGRALHVRVDCEDFHAQRSERLGRLAERAAERVRTGGRSWLLEPMAPDERRLVHMALAEVEDVETGSVGEGYLKRVRVALV